MGEDRFPTLTILTLMMLNEGFTEDEIAERLFNNLDKIKELDNQINNNKLNEKYDPYAEYKRMRGY